jgi:hypothetical protein
MFTVLDQRGSLYFVGDPKSCLEIFRKHPNFTIRESILSERKRNAKRS